jgi:hypothetical protein
MSGDPRETAEARMREILAEAGLREPDEVRYGDGEIVLRWYEERLEVVVDEIPDVDDAAAA